MASEPPSSTPAAEDLLRLNRALDDQVKTLVKTEQRLFQSQRALARRNARLDVLNRFAIEAAELADPREILGRAAERMFSVFPLDQAVGFLARAPGELVPVVARDVDAADFAVPGTVLRVRPLRAPFVDRAGVLRTLPEVAPVFEVVDEIFGEPSEDPATATIVMPLVREAGEPVGLMLFRRLSPVNSFHEEPPSNHDLDFINVVARLVAASVTNAQLLADLKVSYHHLAEAQRELVDRERLAALGEFAAIVAHEVRNPLGVIFNAVSMLRKQVSDGDAAGLLTILGEESQRLDRIVTDLIDFARPNPPRLRPERPLRIVESAIDGVRTTLPGANVSVVAEGEPPEVFADARMVRQAIVNLVINAVHASPEGAPIVVRVAGAHGAARISVEDRGDGVPGAIAARIFDPFFTTKATGTGLGLSVVKRVADAHHGTIEVAAGASGGAVFTLTIPVGEPPRG